MGVKTAKVDVVQEQQVGDYSYFETCLCGMSVQTGAYLVGFLGTILSGIGFLGSLSMGKITESIIEGISTLTYMLVFVGRCKNNYNYYLPLLIVHALAIPTFLTVFVLAILVNFKIIHTSDFPVVVNLKFTIELTKEGLYWTAYNIVTTLISIYLFNITYRSYIFGRRTQRPKK